jgi:acyl-coenzyme A synthetase/AMP-(fatty) acid ligase
LFKATQDWFQFDQTDVWTFFHSHAFDFSVWEIWGSLIYGGRLVIVSYETSRSLIEFKKLLTDEKVTILNQTPTAFNHLINDGSTEISFDPQFLKYIIFGGEALRMQSLEPWIERYGDQHPRLINMYGITETTVHVTYRPITKSDFALGSMIGTPIPDMGVYILEPNLEPAPIGIPGEMFIGGEGLADGYLNRQELTTERFINNPFLPKNKGRLYRTGDLARRLESSDIEYLGRIDRQVQLRGFRIEMGEIESCLSEHPHIEESALLMSEGQPGDQRLLAYVVPNDDGYSEQEIRRYLRTKLPDYMVPSSFVTLEKLPITTNGKLDYVALKDIKPSKVDRLETIVTSTLTETEEVLLSIWRDVFNSEPISIHDDFFEIGGNSIYAMKLSNRIRNRWDVKIGLINIFESQTIHEIARWIDQKLLSSKP